MAASRWIKASLILTLALQFPAASGTPPSFVLLRAGDEVTLRCGDKGHQVDSGSTEWLFSGFRSSATETLVRERSTEVTTRSDRLNVTAELALVIKRVTVEDVGFYTCRQNVSGQRDDADIFLSVVHIAEQKMDGRAVLNCSVLQYEDCRHEVEWLLQGKEEAFSDVEISPPSCSATVTFPTAEPRQKYHESLACKVTNTYTDKAKRFRFNPPPPFTSPDAVQKDPPEQQDFQYFLRGIIVSVGLAVLLTSVVAVNIWTKCKGNRSQMNEDIRLGDKEGRSVALYENIRELSASVKLH